MLKELLSIFRAGEPLAEMGEKFSKMLGLTYDMTIVAGEVYFSESLQADTRTSVYKTDVKVGDKFTDLPKPLVPMEFGLTTFDKGDYDDLFEVRSIIEPQAAALAAERHGHVHVDERQRIDRRLYGCD